MSAGHMGVGPVLEPARSKLVSGAQQDASTMTLNSVGQVAQHLPDALCLLLASDREVDLHTSLIALDTFQYKLPLKQPHRISKG
jgi:hypothetical protein